MSNHISTHIGDVVVTQLEATRTMFFVWPVIESGQQEPSQDGYPSTAMGEDAAKELGRQMALKTDGDVLLQDLRSESLSRLDLVGTCCRVRGPSGRVISCSIYKTESLEIEVHCDYSDDDFFRPQRATELDRAHELAAAWLQAALARGFMELPKE